VVSAFSSAAFLLSGWPQAMRIKVKMVVAKEAYRMLFFSMEVYFGN
jgi:hypothetical protein